MDVSRPQNPCSRVGGSSIFKKSVFSKNPDILSLIELNTDNALHASSLQFKHPINNETFKIECEKSKYFTDLENLIEKNSYANTN